MISKWDNNGHIGLRSVVLVSKIDNVSENDNIETLSKYWGQNWKKKKLLVWSQHITKDQGWK